MRVALYSPLPPAPTGIADYCAELIPALAERVELLELVVPEGTSTSLPLPPRTRVVTQPLAQTVALFHHGNNALHRFVYRSALGRRGVAVLHEPLLHHFIAHERLANEPADWEGYARDLEAAEGSAGRAFAAARRNGLTAPWHTYLLPAIGEIVRASDAVVVHGAYGETLLRRRYPNVPRVRIHHHYSPPPAAIDALSRDEARERLGLDRDQFIVGSFGFVTPPKRVEKALEAFGRARPKLGRALFAVVGELAEFDAATPDRLGLGDAVRLTGKVSLDEFLTWLQAVDVVISLRYPFAGESSGSLIRALGAGKPCIVSRMPYSADHPADVLLTVPVEGSELGDLAAALVRLAGDPQYARALGERARRHAREQCTIESSAAGYVRALEIAERERAGLATFRRRLGAEPRIAEPLFDAVRRLKQLGAARIGVCGLSPSMVTALARAGELDLEPLSTRVDSALVFSWSRAFAEVNDSLAARFVPAGDRRIAVGPR